MKKWLFIGLLWLLPTHGWAQPKPQPMEARLTLAGARILASFDVRTAITARFTKRLRGGLKSTVEIQTQLEAMDGAVVGRGKRSCTLLYDVWEGFFVSVADDSLPSAGIRKLENERESINTCFNVAGLPSALSGAIGVNQTYRLRVRVLLNPLSAEFVRKSRQFIANPHGGAKDRPTEVLGAVAGLIGQDRGVRGSEFQFFSEPVSVEPPQAQERIVQNADSKGTTSSTRTARAP